MRQFQGSSRHGYKLPKNATSTISLSVSIATREEGKMKKRFHRHAERRQLAKVVEPRQSEPRRPVCGSAMRSAAERLRELWVCHSRRRESRGEDTLACARTPTVWTSAWLKIGIRLDIMNWRFCSLERFSRKKILRSEARRILGWVC